MTTKLEDALVRIQSKCLGMLAITKLPEPLASDYLKLLEDSAVAIVTDGEALKGLIDELPKERRPESGGYIGS